MRPVSNVHRPSITVYLPSKEKATGASIIMPGGASRELWINKEGYRVAQWLSQRGIAAFVLKYRLPLADGSTYTTLDHSLADIQRAIRLGSMQADAKITKDLPPTFLCAGSDDGVAASYPDVFKAIKQAGVPVELHMFAGVGHGFALQFNMTAISHWPELFQTWLFERGFLTRK
ncbi:MAG: dienelactone hydrolase family protein [Steroidobacteraceae bacterium]